MIDFSELRKCAMFTNPMNLLVTCEGGSMLFSDTRTAAAALGLTKRTVDRALASEEGLLMRRWVGGGSNRRAIEFYIEEL